MTRLGRVLVLDDDPDVLKAAGMALARAADRVELVASPEAGHGSRLSLAGGIAKARPAKGLAAVFAPPGQTSVHFRTAELSRPRLD